MSRLLRSWGCWSGVLVGVLVGVFVGVLVGVLGGVFVGVLVWVPSLVSVVSITKGPRCSVVVQLPALSSVRR